MGTTFLTLKEQTVNGYKARWYAHGTIPTQGTTTLFIDPFRTEPDGEWERIDAYLKVTSGANNGLVRRITGFSAMPSGNYSLTFSPALPTVMAVSANYDLYKNFDPDDDVGLAINSALRDSFGARAVYSVASAWEPTDGSRVISVPSAAGNTMTRLFKVERPVPSVLNYGSTWFELVNGTDYSILDSAGALSINVTYPTVASTPLRFTGIRPPSDLVNDSDITEEPAHIIELGARKYLALAEGDQAAAERWGREVTLAKSEYFKFRQSESLNVPRFNVGAPWTPRGWPWW